jgi:alkylation response protein AidB-like acyl-CoA dehydrogenase
MSEGPGGAGAAESMEPVDGFRARAREWLAANLPPRPAEAPDRSDDGRREVERSLQRRLHDGGFAGICFPAAYGGLGLTPAHQAAFTQESLPYDMPYSINVPTLGILAATLIDFGTHEQKAAHLPAILRGEELWVQFLSEPSGGSDLAGCRTTAMRDGDEFVLNGSKIWSSAAFAGDYAMCLARTDWDAPKHRGLTMFILRIHQPGITIDRIRQVDGSEEFCQEFFDDVRVPASDVVGEVNEGWTIATRLLAHERQAVGGGSPYVSGRAMGMHRGEPGADAAALARSLGRDGDPHVRRLVARSRVADLVNAQLVARTVQGLSTGALPPAAGSILKLSGATTAMRVTELALEIAGEGTATWPADGDGRARGVGEGSLSRQALSLGGGSNEMQRNLISERLLGMPREHAADRDVPYRDVPHAGRS